MMRAPASSAARAGPTRLTSAETGRSSLVVSNPTAQWRRSASTASGTRASRYGAVDMAPTSSQAAPARAMASPAWSSRSASTATEPE